MKNTSWLWKNKEWYGWVCIMNVRPPSVTFVFVLALQFSMRRNLECLKLVTHNQCKCDIKRTNLKQNLNIFAIFQVNNQSVKSVFSIISFIICDLLKMHTRENPANWAQAVEHVLIRLEMGEEKKGAS